MDRARLHQQLLDNIKTRQAELETALAAVDDEWVTDDLIYRFWHQSLKVYLLQQHTERIVVELEALTPDDCALHDWFRTMVTDGTQKTFELAHNDDWPAHTRPVVEAFLHARHLLAIAVRCGRDLDEAPRWLPSGWATLLELYGIR